LHIHMVRDLEWHIWIGWPTDTLPLSVVGCTRFQSFLSKMFSSLLHETQAADSDCSANTDVWKNQIFDIRIFLSGFVWINP
jgi:hypothetical protein